MLGRIAKKLLVALLVIGALGMLALGPLRPLVQRYVLGPAGIQPPAGEAGVAAITVPDGFRVDVFAQGLDDPRFMALGPEGVVFVAERGRDRVVALPDANGDGEADEVVVIAGDFIAPSSLAFRPGLGGAPQLYVGETTRVSRVELDGLEAEGREVIVDGLPEGHHTTRTVAFGPDGTLFVSIGSSCNACAEEDERRAAVMAFDADTGAGRVFARGLRNAVGLAVNPWSGVLWATVNERDNMGNDLPPDTVHALSEGLDAGWPRCHGGSIPDPELGAGPGSCDAVVAPLALLPAHSAPLGMAFYDGREHDGFPEAYRDDLYIAAHGSWNRVPPTGYSVKRIPLEDGRVAGEAEDFATGWLLPGGDSRGRPAGVLITDDGALLVSDDKAGIVYRIAGDASGQ